MTAVSLVRAWQDGGYAWASVTVAAGIDDPNYAVEYIGKTALAAADGTLKTRAELVHDLSAILRQARDAARSATQTTPLDLADQLTTI